MTQDDISIFELSKLMGSELSDPMAQVLYICLLTFSASPIAQLGKHCAENLQVVGSDLFRMCVCGMFQ